MTKKSTDESTMMVKSRERIIYRRQRIGYRSSGNVSEIAGSTAAEFTAVCCCGPCTVVNLAALAVYKVPAGLYKKALRRKRLRQMIRRGLLRTVPRGKHEENGACKFTGWDDEDLSLLSGLSENEEVTVVMMGGNEMDEELIEFEKEMWDKFHSTGFWRSHSQKESI